MTSLRITKQTVDNAPLDDEDYFIWDTDVKGFGLKVSRGGRKSYICQYRTAGGRTGHTRRFTIGNHGSPWTPDLARDQARRILGDVAHGEDPAVAKQNLKRRMSVSELCDQYIALGCPTKKASTLATDNGRIECHIKPLLGHKNVVEVSRAEIKGFLQDVAIGKTRTDKKTKLRGRKIVTGGKGTASRTLGLLGGIFTYAIDCGIIENSPVRGVKRFPDQRGMRYLSEAELFALGKALKKAEEVGDNKKAVAIIQMLIFTGARRGEIEQLKWSEVDFGRNYLCLADSKTGQKLIPLNAAAVDILAAQKCKLNNSYVFYSDRSDRFFEGLPKIWRRVRIDAGLEGVRIHDLRHSFASVAVSGGASLPIIGALLGHRDTSTTQRYAHLSDDPLRAASEAIGSALAAAMSFKPKQPDIPDDLDETC